MHRHKGENAKEVVRSWDLTSPSWHVTFLQALSRSPPLGTLVASHGCKRIGAVFVSLRDRFIPLPGAVFTVDRSSERRDVVLKVVLGLLLDADLLALGIRRFVVHLGCGITHKDCRARSLSAVSAISRHTKH